MHIFAFLLMYAFASVQIYSFPVNFDACEDICIRRLFHPTDKIQDNCQVGCQYFYTIEAGMEKGTNGATIINDCHLKCNNNFGNDGDNFPCQIGCDAAFLKQQDIFIPLLATDKFEIMDSIEFEDEKDDVLKIQENGVIPTTGSSEKANEEYYRHELYNSTEYLNIHFTSFGKYFIYCVLLLAMIICCLKIMNLFYQLKIVAFKKMLKSSSELEMLNMKYKKSDKQQLLN